MFAVGSDPDLFKKFSHIDKQKRSGLRAIVIKQINLSRIAAWNFSLINRSLDRYLARYFAIRQATEDKRKVNGQNYCPTDNSNRCFKYQLDEMSGFREIFKIKFHWFAKIARIFQLIKWNMFVKTIRVKKILVQLF